MKVALSRAFLALVCVVSFSLVALLVRDEPQAFYAALSTAVFVTAGLILLETWS